MQQTQVITNSLPNRKKKKYLYRNACIYMDVGGCGGRGRGKETSFSSLSLLTEPLIFSLEQPAVWAASMKSTRSGREASTPVHKNIIKIRNIQRQCII